MSRSLRGVRLGDLSSRMVRRVGLIMQVELTDCARGSGELSISIARLRRGMVGGRFGSRVMRPLISHRPFPVSLQLVLLFDGQDYHAQAHSC